MNKKFEIVFDGGADLPKELREKYDIYPEYLNGIIYNPDGSEWGHGDIDWKNITPSEYYAYVKKNAGKMKTAFSSIGEMVQLFEKIIKEGKDILFIGLSSGISGTCNAVEQAKKLVLEDYPDTQIEVVDSLKYSAGVGLLLIEAAKLRDEGLTLTEIAAKLNYSRYLIHESGPMDDLNFLAKSGRLKATKAFFGSLVGVQPLADFNYFGQNEPIGTVKGKDAVEKVTIEYMRNLITDPHDQIILIAHSDRPNRAEKFKETIQKEFAPKEIYVLSVGQFVGANLGPGLCAAFYYGKPITENREAELEAFAEAKKILE